MLLVAHAATAAAVGASGWTALHLGAQGGHHDIVLMLMQAVTSSHSSRGHGGAQIRIWGLEWVEMVMGSRDTKGFSSKCGGLSMDTSIINVGLRAQCRRQGFQDRSIGDRLMSSSSFYTMVRASGRVNGNFTSM